jgi:hypothetical protein
LRSIFKLTLSTARKPPKLTESDRVSSAGTLTGFPLA